ncbi:hypothetical protein [Streptomyces sp. NPDC004284]|uniref:hypothetical protein n=1 Tax=Streptomyces sp. NPDC004284 TaxID=3364695 RepID=UPI00367D48F4
MSAYAIGQDRPRREAALDRAAGTEERGQEPADRVGERGVLDPGGVRRVGLLPGSFPRRPGHVRPAVTAAGLGDGNGEEPQPAHGLLPRYTGDGVREAGGNGHGQGAGPPPLGPDGSHLDDRDRPAAPPRGPAPGASSRSRAISADDSVAVPDSSHIPRTVSSNPAGPPAPSAVA